MSKKPCSLIQSDIGRMNDLLARLESTAEAFGVDLNEAAGALLNPDYQDIQLKLGALMQEIERRRLCNSLVCIPKRFITFRVEYVRFNPERWTECVNVAWGSSASVVEILKDNLRRAAGWRETVHGMWIVFVHSYDGTPQDALDWNRTRNRTLRPLHPHELPDILYGVGDAAYKDMSGGTDSVEITSPEPYILHKSGKQIAITMFWRKARDSHNDLTWCEHNRPRSMSGSPPVDRWYAFAFRGAGESPG